MGWKFDGVAFIGVSLLSANKAVSDDVTESLAA